MPISNAVFVRSTILFVLAGMLALLAIVATSLWLVGNVQTYFGDFVQLRAVRSASADLLSVLKDAETGQRGYLITAEDAYLAPFNEAVAELATRQSDLQQKMERSSVPSDALPRLDKLVAGKIQELNETIDLAKAGRRDEAIAVVRTDRGKVLMEEIRAILDVIIADADAKLQSGIDATSGAAMALKWTTVVGAVAIVAVLIGAIGVIVTHLRELIATRRQVEILNTGLERRVEERTHELIRANQEIQKFAYIVTHDLRAPLVNIMGFTSELQACLKSVQAYILGADKPLSDQDIREARQAASDDLPEAIGIIRSSTKKMDGLINAILKISRDGRRLLKIEDIDLNDLVQAAGSAVSHQVTGAEGRIDVAPHLPAIKTDRLSLEQVFGNLFDNAVKYQQPGRPPVIAISSSTDTGGGITVEFKDNGRGIDPEDHERIFELFRRSGDQDQPGEGIGLAHVRSLVRNLGGDITVKSALGAGTAFSIFLPKDLSKIVRSTQE